MGPAVEALFLFPPVETRAPRLAEVAQIREVGAVAPTRSGDLVGPAGAREPVTQIGENRVGNVDAKRPEFVAHAATLVLRPVTLSMFRPSRGRRSEAHTTRRSRSFAEEE